MIDKETLRTDKDFSTTPVAMCSAGKRHDCSRGDGTYCYCHLGCTAKTNLNGDGKMIKEELDFINKVLASLEK